VVPHFLDFMTLEDEGTVFLLYIRNFSSSDTASHPRIPEFSATQLWKP
jgi:hypothetical protein